jgi:hypothetical protein
MYCETFSWKTFHSKYLANNLEADYVTLMVPRSVKIDVAAGGHRVCHEPCRKDTAERGRAAQKAGGALPSTATGVGA